MKKEIVTAIVGGIIEAVVGIIVSRQGTSVINVLLAIFILNTAILAAYTIYIRRKLKNYENVGIVDCTAELKGTDFVPIRCMQIVRKSMWFMGIGGAKWIEKADVRQQMETMLRKVQANHGEVRYLLLDPESEAYKQLRELRQNSVPIESYKLYCDMVKKYSCLKVKLYSHMPTFRLQFVDEQYLAVSRYYIERDVYDQTGYGWQSPHLIVHDEIIDNSGNSKAHKGSLYGSFKELYEFIWEHSRDLCLWENAGNTYK